ncbi:hypothetical protein ABE25_13580 [Cytobacillus firmus]|nr:hypothetical protein [Cytobacillus firmus]MBG9603166.1 hypothetical protein [Cytobacillus firmus]
MAAKKNSKNSNGDASKSAKRQQPSEKTLNEARFKLQKKSEAAKLRPKGVIQYIEISTVAGTPVI